MSELTARARALADAARTGPWFAQPAVSEPSSEDYRPASVVRRDPSPRPHLIVTMPDPDQDGDAEFIAEARTLVPDLADEVDAAAERIGLLEEAVRLLPHFDECWERGGDRETDDPHECVCPKQRAPGSFLEPPPPPDPQGHLGV